MFQTRESAETRQLYSEGGSRATPLRYAAAARRRAPHDCGSSVRQFLRQKVRGPSPSRSRRALHEINLHLGGLDGLLDSYIALEAGNLAVLFLIGGLGLSCAERRRRYLDGRGCRVKRTHAAVRYAS
jgi:hypothetical protein